MRLPAIKSVFDTMTAEEKTILETKQDKMMQEGYPKQTKQRYVNANANANADNY